MNEPIIMYDETERTDTRYIGFVGDSARFDMMITTTAHFYGKKVVTCLQTNRSAILNQKDLENVYVIQESFALASEEEAEELCEFLLAYV